MNTHIRKPLVLQNHPLIPLFVGVMASPNSQSAQSVTVTHTHTHTHTHTQKHKRANTHIYTHTHTHRSRQKHKRTHTQSDNAIHIKYIFKLTASLCFKKSQLSGKTSKDNDPIKINQRFDLPG